MGKHATQRQAIPLIISRFLALAALHAVTANAQEAAPDTAGNAVTTICDDARYTRFAANKLASKINEAMSDAAALQTAAISYRIAAAGSANLETKAALTALSIAQDKAAKEATEAVAKAKKQYDEAIRLLRLREGRLHSVMQNTFKVAAPSGGAPIGSSTVHNLATVYGCSATQTLQVDAAANCSLETDDSGSVKYSEVNIAAATAIKTISEAALKPQTLTAKAYEKGTESTATFAHTAKQGYCTDTNGNGADLTGKSAIIGAELQVTSRTVAAETTALYKQGTTGECQQTKITAPWGEQKAATIAAALCDLRKAPLEIPTPLHKQTLANLETNVDIAEALNQAQAPGSALADDTKERKQLVNKYFGNNDIDFKAKIEQAIQKTEIDVTIGKTKIKKSPLALAGTEEGIQVLSYYFGKDLAAKKAVDMAAPVPTMNKEASDKCKAITDKEKCKAEDGCELKGENCVAAEKNKGKEKKEEKCTGKLEPECTKAPDCKWEDNKCKDSSILPNKHFGASVVSAAFVALLF
uniref:Variant surface glycoprotein 1125.4052 n=1 Tax=Trypanosoma brucei TaxID=5691 RepID=A0A1J0R9S2_9TRYP|nr:variant surface glycoprotein 1125.4052 [Trypanosoma brucei]